MNPLERDKYTTAGGRITSMRVGAKTARSLSTIRGAGPLEKQEAIFDVRQLGGT